MRTINSSIKILLPIAIVLLLLHCFSTVVLGNGGPTDFSNTLGTGNIDFYQYRDVKLVAEELTIKPGFKYVDVEARYFLQSIGETDSVHYAFPVDLIPSEYVFPDYGLSIQEEVPYFEISLNGVPLDYEVRQLFDNNIYLNSYSEELSIQRVLFITSFLIEPGQTIELVVKYQFKAFFCDISTSKDFFSSFEDRFFQYELAPAGFWGDGFTDELTIEFDFTEVMENDGYVVNLPDVGEWLDNSHYVIYKEHFSMLTEDDLKVTYNVSEWGRTNELLDLSLKIDECDISVSSTLEGDYSVANLFDRNLSTAWSEGAEGCMNQWIDIVFDKSISVCCIGVVSGYTKNQFTYEANAKPENVTFEIFGLDGEVCYEESVLLENLTWESLESKTLFSKTQFLYLNGGGFEATRIRISFDSVFAGSSYEDLCISELFVAGWQWD